MSESEVAATEAAAHPLAPLVAELNNMRSRVLELLEVVNAGPPELVWEHQHRATAHSVHSTAARIYLMHAADMLARAAGMTGLVGEVWHGK